jgi:N-acetylglucosamine-6-sulfatase
MVCRLVGLETAAVTNRPARLAIAAAALLAGTVGAAIAIDAPGTAAAGAPSDRVAQSRPNVIVVMTDDQSVGELSRRSMPHTIDALRDHGTTFSNSIVSSPLCCPARAGLLTGQYPHNNGVYDNEPGYSSLNHKRSTLYSWLQAAGYRTGHIGRWLLNYHRPAAAGDPDTGDGFAPPPGIDHWFGFRGPSAAYYGATFSRNGTPVTLSERPSGYITRAINREALDFVRAAKSDPRPFFLNVSQIAPHSANEIRPGPCGIGGLPIPERGAFKPWRSEPLPRPPSFDESRIRDKPDWVQQRSPIGRDRRKGLELGWRCALATLPTVDRGVGRLIDRLAAQGELDETAIFFTSDNGYLFGQHRIFLNKVYPYEESIRVPLLARLPGQPRQPAKVGVPVNNLDLTATILDLARAAPCTATGDCRILDGRSLVPLLRGRHPRWGRGRALLIQLGSVRDCGTPTTQIGGLNTFYDAVRTRRHLYVELDHLDRETGVCDRPEYELYDLRGDPFQLRNRATYVPNRPPRPRQAGLAARLASLRDCAGIAGRDPAGARPFCE